MLITETLWIECADFVLENKGVSVKPNTIVKVLVMQAYKKSLQYESIKNYKCIV